MSVAEPRPVDVEERKDLSQSGRIRKQTPTRHRETFGSLYILLHLPDTEEFQS